MVDLQDRLDRLWTLLCMPDVQRLDMAIKYSSEPYKNNLSDVSTLGEGKYGSYAVPCRAGDMVSCLGILAWTLISSAVIGSKNVVYFVL